ncbi:MAG: hypothetical protein JST00_08090 [Deltaproteobacteria bacterium]|nr:hypothetical protein [Deltaproteobacteria bacterium]
MRTTVFLASALVLALAAACSSTTSPTDPSNVPPSSPPVDTTPLPALGMNDVSVLFPLPKSPSSPGYLKPEDEGAKGPLLTKADYDKIPTFPHEGADTLDFARMRVIAIRFDGCFPAPGGCEPQIRLVMQPIADDGEGLDSAIHLFYRLTEAEIAEVVTGLRKLRALAPEQKDAPLEVSPALVAQGATGDYGNGLRELVLKYAGRDNFSRMTFFLRAPPTVETWFLGGFDRKNGALEALDIVSVGKSNQRVIRSVTAEGYAYDLLPLEKTPEDTSLLLSSAKMKAAPKADLERALGAYLRILNPQKYGPDQLPCAGCHLSTFVTQESMKMGVDPKAMPDAFTSKRDISVKGASTTNGSSLRAFGWFVKDASISQRVANETAGVVDDFEKRFPASPPAQR